MDGMEEGEGVGGWDMGDRSRAEPHNNRQGHMVMGMASFQASNYCSPTPAHTFAQKNRNLLRTVAHDNHCEDFALIRGTVCARVLVLEMITADEWGEILEL